VIGERLDREQVRMTPDDTPQAPPPPDAGEPQGARDSDRPAMLGRTFEETVAGGMLTGLVLALVGHWLLIRIWYGHVTGWSWPIVALGGLAVGGAVALFLYGTATDRSDTGPKRRGQADVSERGEWRRTLERRRQRRPATRQR
jgi:hypothetical protein